MYILNLQERVQRKRSGYVKFTLKQNILINAVYSQLLFVLMCKWPSITTLILYYPSKVVFLSLVLRYFNTISLLSLYQYRTFSNHYQRWLFLRQSLPLLELVYYFYVQIRQATICDRGKPSMSILGT